ncbi:MAG: hypothetical protein HQM15_02925 [Deltaproteobacteria bacterium]|nr:hypothetical protein [Deltaproteobacteria bacterium]
MKFNKKSNVAIFLSFCFMLSFSAYLACSGSNSTNSDSRNQTTDSTGNSSGGSNGSGGSVNGEGSGGSGTTQGNLSSVASSWSNGAPPDLGAYHPFLSSNDWYTNISNASVDADSDNIIADVTADNGGTLNLQPDFGSSLFLGNPIGIPYDVVSSSSTSMTNITIGENGYPEESDPGPNNSTDRIPIPAPLPSSTHIEGGNDHHVLLIDKDNYWLYEIYHAVNNRSSWTADQVTLWDLQDNTKRPWTWTSADQAGLSVFAGLVRYDEVQNAIASNGDMGHAIRVTVSRTLEAFIPPASHPGGGNDPTAHSAKMGMRFRLKSSYLQSHLSDFSPQNQVILRTLAKYGMIVADTGSDFLISGTQDARWIEEESLGGIAQLLNVPGSAFEVVAHSTEYTRANAPTGNAPILNSFSANPASIVRGASVTLNWNVSNASTAIITPDIGPVRGSSISIHPSSSATYTLYVTNEFGRSSGTVNVNVE